MKVPDDILKKVEALEAKNREYEEVKKRAAKAEEERIERIEKYRQSKMYELMPAADKIMQWINEFSNDFNDDGQRILAVNYSIIYTPEDFGVANLFRNPRFLVALFCLFAKKEYYLIKNCIKATRPTK